jgi:hypothetical protein
MQQALTSSLCRSIAVGGLLLALTVAHARGSKPHMHHLALHAVDQPRALYLTAWRNGMVSVPLKGDKLVPLRFSMIASINDGCRWEGIETLMPIDNHRYVYRYDEEILECEPGADPYIKTPRTGLVTVED